MEVCEVSRVVVSQEDWNWLCASAGRPVQSINQSLLFASDKTNKNLPYCHLKESYMYMCSSYTQIIYCYASHGTHYVHPY